MLIKLDLLIHKEHKTAVTMSVTMNIGQVNKLLNVTYCSFNNMTVVKTSFPTLAKINQRLLAGTEQNC